MNATRHVLSPAAWQGIFLLLPAALVALLFYPVLGFENVWDDDEWIEMIQHSSRSTAEWFRYVFAEPSIITSRYYRPLASFTFFAQRGAQQVAHWHAFSYGLAITNSLLFSTLVLRALTPHRAAAPLTQRWLCLALLIAAGIHPIHTELVGWASARFDLMVVFFLLLTTLLLLSAAGIVLKGVAGSALLLLALCSKESAITYFPLIPFILFLPRWLEGGSNDFMRQQFRHWPVYGGALIALLVYLLLRRQATGVIPQDIPTGDWHQWGRVLETYGHFIRLLLLPFFDLSPVHTFTPHQPLYIALGAMLMAAGAGLWGLHRPTGIIVGLFIVLLIPYSNLLTVSLYGDIIQNRYLVLPLYLLCFALAAAGCKYHRVIPRAALLVITAWLLLCLISTQHFLPNWKHRLDLWRWTVEENPGAVRPLVNYAEVKYLAGDVQESIPLFEQADRLAPGCETQAWLGISHAQLKHTDQANIFFDAAFADDSGCSNQLFIRANLVFIQLNLDAGNLRRAGAALEKYQASGARHPAFEQLLKRLEQARQRK